MLIHGGLLLVSCALLPILPNVSWKPTAIGDPTLRILELLAATIGLPYFLLSSTSPCCSLVCAAHRQQRPYRFLRYRISGRCWHY